MMRCPELDECRQLDDGTLRVVIEGIVYYYDWDCSIEQWTIVRNRARAEELDAKFANGGGARRPMWVEEEP